MSLLELQIDIVFSRILHVNLILFIVWNIDSLFVSNKGISLNPLTMAVQT